MNDDELRKFLSNFEATGIPNREITTEIATPGSGMPRLLKILAIIFWTVGGVILICTIGAIEFILFDRADNRRPPQMADAIGSAIWLGLSALSLAIAAMLTVAHSLMAKVVQLHKVNAAWTAIFKQIQAEKKAPAE